MPANLDIKYERIAKILIANMIILITDSQHLLYIDLTNQINSDRILAIYSTDSNIILHFCNLFENLMDLSELREQSAEYNEEWNLLYYL